MHEQTPEEQQDWSEVAAWNDAVEIRAAEFEAAAAVAEGIVAAVLEQAESAARAAETLLALLPVRHRRALLTGHTRPRSKAMRRADAARSRAVAAIERDVRREAQRKAGGSWRA